MAQLLNDIINSFSVFIKLFKGIICEAHSNVLRKYFEVHARTIYTLRSSYQFVIRRRIRIVIVVGIVQLLEVRCLASCKRGWGNRGYLHCIFLAAL